MSKYLLLFTIPMFLWTCSDQIVSTCDDALSGVTVNANFSSIQTNVFTPSCAKSGCHSGANPSVGLSLEAIVAYGNLINVASQQSSLLLVKPGDSGESWIIRKMKAENTSLMPPGVALSSVVIDSIATWIDKGALND